jgi:hypothetical protein
MAVCHADLVPFRGIYRQTLFPRQFCNTMGKGNLDNSSSNGPVERLFPFAVRARILIVGRDILARSKSRLHFILITRDLSEGSRSKILSDFAHYPVVQQYTTQQLHDFFGFKGARVIGFAKSGLAQSIYAELKQYRINPPVAK